MRNNANAMFTRQAGKLFHAGVRKKSRQICLIIAGIFMFQLSVFAQQRVTGKVTSATDNLPVETATVQVKSTSVGTVTAADGSFSLNVPAGATTLVITSLNFATKEVPIGNGTNLLISLTPVAGSLSEVIVVGYGTQQKKDLTGSIATVTAKDFQRGVITSPEQMIAGKVPGVSIISNSGQPGSGSTIRIRGGASFSNNDPLIVIDGVPLDNNNVAGSPNQLSFINPNDVESFTILKDASAAAIYGTRASNGVIIITTKKGSSGGLRVNFSTVNSLSSITKKVSVLSADEFRSIVNTSGTPAQKAMLGTTSTDWQDQIYRTAFTTDNNISFTGGIAKLPYRVSLGYLNQDGVLKTDNLKKFALALVLNPTFFNNHLKVDINLKATQEKIRFGNQGAIGAATSFDPTHPVTVNSPRYGGYYEWVDASGNLINLAGRNPVGLLNQQFNESDPARSIGNVQFDYRFHFLPELRANLNMGYDIWNGKGTNFVSDSAAADYTRAGRSTQYQTKTTNTVFDFYLNYAKDIPSIKSRVDVLGGYSYNGFLTTNYNFADYNARGVKLPNSDPAFPFNKPEHTLVSFFGRLNYSYNDRYLLTATLRRDGSSRFAPANRWGLFPSVALAWKILDDKNTNAKSTVSALKLRVGYGVTGQQDGIGNYDYLSYYALSSQNATYQFGNTFYQGFRPGGFYADRKWEQTANTNLALEYGFLNNRITGTIEVYHKKTTDLLSQVAQPAGTNFSAFIVANVGDMENKGVEFSVNAQPLRRKDLTWDVAFNVTYNENKITNLTVIPGDTNYIGFQSGTIAGGIGGQFAQINAVGGSRNTFYLYRQVYDKDGKPIEGLFVDKNKDGLINQSDLYKGRSSIPKVFMGFSTSFTYKKWYGGFVMRASLDNYVYNNAASQGGTQSQILGNSVLYNGNKNYLETKFTGGNGQQLLSDYYIQNASFLRMDNLNIGYNMGRVFRDKANLRLNFTVQNVFVVTDYTGLDPEIASGIDNNFYPRPRIYSLGVNLDF
jgi:TonB-linked SusC/RagA family outer membrane protein